MQLYKGKKKIVFYTYNLFVFINFWPLEQTKKFNMEEGRGSAKRSQKATRGRGSLLKGHVAKNDRKFIKPSASKWHSRTHKNSEKIGYVVSGWPLMKIFVFGYHLSQFLDPEGIFFLSLGIYRPYFLRSPAWLCARDLKREAIVLRDFYL